MLPENSWLYKYIEKDMIIMTNKIQKNADGTYPLVNSVEEAALVLDLHRPGWHNLINLDTFNCSQAENCICRQVYDKEWPYPLWEIFGQRQYESDPYCEIHNTRNIFAGSTDKWKVEIINRKNGVAGIITDFGWAMLQLKNGKFVRSADFDKGHYWFYDTQSKEIYRRRDDSICIGRVHLHDISDKFLTAKNWEVYIPPVYLTDVKPGQKFQFKNDPEVTYVKAILGSDCLKDNVYFSLRTYMVHQTNHKTEVIIME